MWWYCYQRAVVTFRVPKYKHLMRIFFFDLSVFAYIFFNVRLDHIPSPSSLELGHFLARDLGKALAKRKQND